MTVLEDMELALADALSPHVYVNAVDRPGHGENTRPSADRSLFVQARHFRLGLQRLGLKKPVIVGHSLGGSVALTLATRAPGWVSSVLALAPLAFPEPRLEQILFGPRAVPGWATGWQKVRRALPIRRFCRSCGARCSFRRSSFRESFPFSLLQLPEATIASGEDALAASASLFSIALLYESCVLPVRILAGENDLVVNNRLQAQALAGMMPHASLAWLSGLGHMIHHFAQEQIRAELQKLSAGLRRELRALI